MNIRTKIALLMVSSTVAFSIMTLSNAYSTTNEDEDVSGSNITSGEGTSIANIDSASTDSAVAVGIAVFIVAGAVVAVAKE